MSAYQIVVVGTDGSDSSLRAVDRAGEIAAESNAKLVIATGYLPHSDDLRAADLLVVVNVGVTAVIASKAKADVLIVYTAG